MPANPTLADIANPILLGGLGYFACSILSLAMIVLIEGTVLRLLGWGSWKIAFGHAFIINLVTSLIGTGLLISFKVEQFYQIPVPGLFIGAFLLTVIVETIELKVLRRSVSFSRVSLNSLLANINRKAARKLVLLGIVDSGRVPGNKTTWMEPPAVVVSSTVVITAVAIATVATPVMIAPGARVIPGIGIPVTASVGSRS
jgi:hypothetical protein